MNKDCIKNNNKPEYLLSNDELNTAIRTLLEYSRTPFLNQSVSDKTKNIIEDRLSMLLAIQEQRATLVFNDDIAIPDAP